MTVEALLERLLTELPRRIAAELRRGDARPLSITAAARTLKMRRKVLQDAVTAGLVATVPWKAKHPRIGPDEIERLRREGLPEKRTRRRRNSRPSVADQIMALKVD